MLRFCLHTLQKSSYHSNLKNLLSFCFPGGLEAKVEIIVREGDQEGRMIASMIREIGASDLVLGLHDQSFLYRMAMAYASIRDSLNCRVLAIKQPATTSRDNTAISFPYSSGLSLLLYILLVILNDEMISRQPWRKSMISVMAWLRPEVTTQETIYGIEGSDIGELYTQMDADNDHVVSKRRNKFNAADFYEAIKPPKDAPILEDELSDLLPELRPYQRRAAYWMVKREKGALLNSCKLDQN